MTPIDKALDDLFPTWFKKIQVTFLGQLPLSDKERQQVFVVPYAMFEKALTTLIQDEIRKARIDEQTHTQADIDGNVEYWPDGVTVMSQLERLAELDKQ